jgi:putative lipoic acid-binding regulatory protein
MAKDYSKIRDLLEAQERFPIDYIHKVIGRNTAAFLQSVERLEAQLPAVRRDAVRPSASQVHVSVTLVLRAEKAADVIQLLEATELLEDLVMVL